MIVVSIGTDRKIFEAGSAARARMIEYGKLFGELHIIVFALASHTFSSEKISDNVWIYPTNSKRRWRYPFDARKVFRTELAHVIPDVITAQDPFESGLAGWLIRRSMPAKLHIQIHTDFMSKYFRRSSSLNQVRVIIAKWLLPKADRVRVVSDRIRDSLASIDETLPARTTVLPMYTNVDAFRNAPITLDLHKQYPQFSFIILMVSRLSPEKNIGMALSVVRDVVVKHKDVGLVIVGDGPEKKYLQGLALTYHLDRNVIFESWQSDLASHYRTADVFLTTSLYEGYGLTLVEAAASGCPIITSDVGIAERVVEQSVTGFIANLDDASSFTDNILAMINEPGKKEAMKHAAEKLAHDKVGTPREEYLRNYKAMLTFTHE